MTARKVILILDPGWPQTLYEIAALRDAGFEIVLASPILSDPRGVGSYCRQINSPQTNDPGYRDFLVHLLQSERFDILLPTSETIAVLLWQLPDELVRGLHPRTAPWQRRLILDRHNMYEFAHAAGLRTPERIALLEGSEAELQRALAILGAPLVIRGTQGTAGKQVRIAHDVDAGRVAYADIRHCSPGVPFAQRFIAGRRCLIGGLFDAGRPLQWFEQETIEMYPAPAGPSIRVRSVSDPRLTHYGEALFSGLVWSGLGCAEFIRDANDDYTFLDFNPRAWTAIMAARSCGVDFFHQFAGYLAGNIPSEQQPYKVGVECVLFPQYFVARLQAGTFGRWRDVIDYLRSLSAAPWSRLHLLYHFGRTLWWSRPAPAEEASRAHTVESA